MMNISGKTTVFGVIGDPIEHTFSPLIHNRAIAAMELDAVYVPFHVAPERLGEAVDGVRAFGIGGLNVTVPHKTAVMQYLDGISDEAEAVGAINTIIRRDSVLMGDNTDVYGFLMCVMEDGGIGRFPARVCVLGAGGAARGIVYACAGRDEVDDVVVVNRTLSKVETIAADFSGMNGTRVTAVPATAETLSEAVTHAGMVVNTTSLGMYPHTDGTPVPDPDVFREGQVVCDIIYNPLRTRFLRDAASRGAKTIEGLAMLAYQGARSLSLWTGREAPAGVMLDALREVFTPDTAAESSR